LAAILALAAGCEKRSEGAEPATASSPGASTEPAPSPDEAEAQAHEPQPVFEGTYAPMSRTAEAITDELEFQGDTLQFGFGHTYETEPSSMIRQGSAAGRGFTETLSVAPGTYLEIRKVTSELVNPRAENGGLCRPEATRWLVFAAIRDGNETAQQVAMAAYKGAAAPTSASAQRNLCGTFNYTRPTQ
jgi:hypothetical protein